MELNNDDERKALGLLTEGRLNAREISEQLGMSYSTVLRINRQLNEAVERGEMHDLVATQKSELEEVEGTVANAMSITLLERNVVSAAMALASRVRMLAIKAESAGEIKSLTESIVELNNSFFKDMRPQVSVNNTNIHGDAAQVMYGDLLNDKPKNI